MNEFCKQHSSSVAVFAALAVTVINTLFKTPTGISTLSYFFRLALVCLKLTISLEECLSYLWFFERKRNLFLKAV